MADIVFLPVCSSCGHFIEEDIICHLEEVYAEKKGDAKLMSFLQPHIYPYECPNCHRRFDCIKLPTIPPNKMIKNEFDWKYEQWRWDLEWK